MDVTAVLTSLDPETAKNLMEPAVISAASVSSTNVLLIFAVFIMLFAFICLIFCLCNSSKSKQYRELVSDMYVAGVVKKFAKEDGVDLEIEYKEFKKWEKKSKMSDKNLDSAIEANLKDKVSEKTEIEIAKLK